MTLNCFGKQLSFCAIALAAICVLALPATSSAQPTPREVALEKKVQDLESRLVVLEQLLLNTAASGVGPSPSGTVIGLSDGAPIAPSENNLIERIRTKIFEAEIAQSQQWLMPATWVNIREGMTEAEVEAILGKPTRKLESLKLRVDMVWFYDGTNRATGQEVEGKISFLRGKVKSIEAPQL